MSNPVEEKISSLLDDELAPADRDQLIKQLKQSSAHKEILGRYCLIQEAMKKNLPTDPKHNLFARVSTALESEPVLFAPSNDLSRNNTESSNTESPIDTPDVTTSQHEAAVKSPFSIPSFGWAAAAAVAMVAIVSSVNLSGVDTSDAGGALDLVAKQSTQEFVVPVMSSQASTQQGPVLVSGSRPLVQVPQVMPNEDQWDRIDQNTGIAWGMYLKEHGETASQTGVQPGVVPFARIVSFEGEGQQQ
ncbi:MAG: sigma-E factor negative regulatory protein [Gammaproteobacteria bacterium]|nr:sigma-E factor negative regulatory protein [Gammaproteobacteria bacterium]